MPEERKRQGLALPLSVKHNINCTSYGDISTLGVVQQKAEKERSRLLVEKMNIRTPSIEQIVKNLSGGNQQKVAIAKWFCRNVDVFLMDEPTTGIDIGAKVEIYHLIETLISEGKAVILVSSYLPEIKGLSDRILVMAEGEITGEVQADKADEESILRMASKISIGSKEDER